MCHKFKIRTARTYFVVVLLFFGWTEVRSNGNDNLQLSEICSSPSSDSDSDGIPDSCDCEPNTANEDEFEISGVTEICGDQVVEYSAHINGLVINEVEFNTSDILELKNYGSEPIDITGYFIDAGTNSALVGPDKIWKTLSGNYIVDPNEIVQLQGDIINPDSEIAIYKSVINNDATNIVSYVKYGNPTMTDNLLNAIIAGLWDQPEDCIDVSGITPAGSKSIEYDGHGNRSSDWKVNDHSLGEENEFRSPFIWEFTGVGEMDFGNSQSISLDFADAISGDLIFYLLEGTNCIQSRTVVSITVNDELIWYVDQDMDGFGDPNSTPIVDCDDPSGLFNYIANNEDCDDNDPDVHAEQEWFLDADGDGLGDPNDLTKLVECSDPSDEVMSYVLNSLDPDDSNEDFDGDGLKDGDEVEIHNTNPSLKDTDMDGLDDGDELSFGTDPNEPDSDNDGCTDGEEILNVTDPNNPNSGAGSLWYADSDSDGFGDSQEMKLTCTQPEGYVSNSSDCDDNDDNVFPGAPTRADGKDNDCDGIVDKLGQIITFEEFEDFVLTDEVIILSAASSSELPVTFVVTGPAIVSLNSMVFKGAGQVTITARQPGDDFYLPAEVVHTFCVNPRTPIIKQNDNQLNINSTNGNLWFKNGVLIEGEAGNSLVTTGDGAYTAQTIVDGCTSEVSEEFVSGLSVTTGVLDEIKKSIKVYPNPVTQYLHFDFGHEIRTDIIIELTNISGQIYGYQKFISTSVARDIFMDVSTYDSGVYFYKMNIGNRFIPGKIIKN